MDLKSLAMNTNNGGVWMEVRNPHTGEVMDGVKLLVCSSSTPAIRAALHRTSTTLAASNLANDTEGYFKLQDAEMLKVYAIMIKDWSGIEWDGAELECNEQNKVMILTSLDWLTAQVDTFSARRTNFIGK